MTRGGRGRRRGRAAVDLARHLRPDVVLADIRMPRLDGLEVTAAAGRAPTRVIVVTTFDLDEYVHTALRNGACGFLLKRSGPGPARSRRSGRRWPVTR